MWLETVSKDFLKSHQVLVTLLSHSNLDMQDLQVAVLLVDLSVLPLPVLPEAIHNWKQNNMHISNSKQQSKRWWNIIGNI